MMDMNARRARLRRGLMIAVSAGAIVAGAQPGHASGGNGNRLVNAPNPAAQAARAAASNVNVNASASAAAKRAAAAFTRASSARRSMDAAQAAARAAAIAKESNIPDGLGTGGLDVDPGVGGDPSLWVNADAPRQGTGSDGRTKVVVRQTDKGAILTWRTFNVGKKTDLAFDQAGRSDWVALNRVNDPAAKPSQILGTISAPGQVYVINRNGVIFGGSAAVDTHTIVASSLDVGVWGDPVAKRNERFLAGILTPNKDDPVGGINPTFSAVDTADAIGADGKPTDTSVTVEAGAVLRSGLNGTVLLMAPRVVNRGAVFADNGQALLAAGTAVNLRAPPPPGPNQPFNPGHPQAGFIADVLWRQGGIDPDDTQDNFFKGTVVNDGLISAARGNITLTGYGVVHNGIASATTSKDRTGSVIMHARDLDGNPGSVGHRAGPLQLGKGSLISILGEAGDGQFVYNTGTFRQSVIDLTGNAVAMLEDSTVLAPAALMYVSGGGSGPAASDLLGGVTNAFVMEKGALINLAGTTGAEVSVGRNIIAVDVRSNELRDSPLQKGGFLQGETVYVDSRIGTNLFDYKGFADLVPYSVLERQGIGGSLSVNSSATILREGSGIDVSGGYLTYIGDTVRTTRLLGADGRAYDVGAAPPAVPIVGFAGQVRVDHARWGVTDVYATPLIGAKPRYEAGYVEGFDAGAVAIEGRLYADGEIFGERVVGERQAIGTLRNDANVQTSIDLPKGGSLTLTGLVNPTFVQETLKLPDSYDTSLREITLEFDEYNGIPRRTIYAPDTPLPANRYDNQIAIGSIVDNGFTNLVVEGTGLLHLQAGQVLSLPDGASIDLTAGKIIIDGAIVARGGSIALSTTYGYRFPAHELDLTQSPLLRDIPPNIDNYDIRPGDGILRIGSTGLLSTAGTWINNAADGETGSGRFIDGGSTTLVTRRFVQLSEAASRDIILDKGATFDVSGGGFVSSDERPSFGDGGDIVLRQYGDWYPEIPQNPPAPSDETYRIINHGAVFLAHGMGIAGGGAANGLGGSISYRTGRLAFGAPPLRPDGTPQPNPTIIDFADYANSGLASFSFETLNGTTINRTFDGIISGTAIPPYRVGDVNIAEGQVIAPIAETRVLGDDYLSLATGTAITDLGKTRRLDRLDRSPIAIRINAGGALTVSTGSVITADPGAARPDAHNSIALGHAYTGVVHGRLEARGGSIAVTGNATVPGGRSFDLNCNCFVELPIDTYDLSRATWIASDAVLDASGFVDSMVDPASGLRYALARAGGNVTLTDSLSYVVVAEGSLIDVSGAAGVTQVARRVGFDRVVETRAVASDAGSITLGGSLGGYFEGTIVAHGGSEESRGGTLALRSFLGIDRDPRASYPVFNNAVVVRQSGDILPDGLAPGDVIDPTLERTVTYLRDFEGNPLLDRNGNPIVDTSTWSGDLTGRTILVADALAGTGIDAVHLSSTNLISFEGNVDLSVGRMIQLEAPTIGFQSPAPDGVATPGAVKLSAPYIRLGSPPVDSRLAVSYDRTDTAGSLSLAADWIDLVGSTKLIGIRNTRLASGHDIRLNGIGNADYIFPIPGNFSITRRSVAGSIRSSGNLTFVASQIYGATDTDFTIASTAAEGVVAFRSNGVDGVMPLSAASQLTVEAHDIVQDGVVRAPFGSIRFRPANSIRFEDGSLTSVSSEGLLVPWGETRAGGDAFGYDWFQGSVEADQILYDSRVRLLPEKAIEVGGNAVSVEAGAVIDASGGGDLLATRFVPGPGGSNNLLTPYVTSPGERPSDLYNYDFLYADQRDVYAIVPGVQPYTAPVANLQDDSGLSLGTGTAILPNGKIPRLGNIPVGEIAAGVGEQVYFANGLPGLAPGYYTLLPGRYAILPGAMLVTQTPASQTLSPSSHASGAHRLGDGSYLVAGVRSTAGTGDGDVAASWFQVSPASAWQKRSEFVIDRASNFFRQKIDRTGGAEQRLPTDAGRLVLAAQQSLLLDGQTKFDHAAGARGGQIDIAADRIAITPGGIPYAGAENVLSISDAQINALGAESLLIGGRRSLDLSGERIDITTSLLVAAEGADFAAPELLLGARGSGPEGGLIIEAGASVLARGTVAPGGDGTLRIGGTGDADAGTGDGAIIRLSNGAPVTVIRGNMAGGATSAISVADGAALAGGASLLIDAPGDTRIGGAAALTGEALDLASSLITIGESDAATGLVLGSGALDRLADVGRLTLRSATRIDFVGDIAIGGLAADGSYTLGELVLDAAAVTGNGAAIALSASRVTLTNSGGTTTDATAAGTGTLDVAADRLVFGAGRQALSGFRATRIAAGGAVSAEGLGIVSMSGDLRLDTSLLTGETGANVSLTVAGAFTLASNGVAAGKADGFGARIGIDAARVDWAGTAISRGGSVSVRGRNGDVALAAGSVLDVSGFAKTFFDETRYISGGSATLIADKGNVTVAEGAAIRVDAADPAALTGGLLNVANDAGSVRLVAGGAVVLAGAITGAAGPNAVSGSFTLDSGIATDLDALNQRLDAGGFFDSRSIRTRTGDLSLTRDVTARSVEIVADGGTLSIDAVIDASGDKAGTIGLYGRDGVVTSAATLLDAHGSGTGARGGTIEIGSMGTVDLAGRADVHGTGAAGGLVRVRLPVGGVAGSGFGMRFDGARRVEIEPFVTVSSPTLDFATIEAAFNGVDAAAIRDTHFARAPANLHVTPGVDLVNAGTIVLPADAPVDLHGLRAGGSRAEGGVLTIRAAGDVDLLASLSDAFSSATADGLIQDGQSWSYRIVAGADLDSANPLATLDQSSVDAIAGDGAGNVHIGLPWSSGPTTAPIVRTGTGFISVAASRDIALRDPDATLYTAGRPIADHNLVVGVDANGKPATGVFYDQLYPTFNGFYPNAPVDDPSLIEVPNPNPYPAAYLEDGGDVMMRAGRDIIQTITDEQGRNVTEVASQWFWTFGATDPQTLRFVYRPAGGGYFDDFLNYCYCDIPAYPTYSGQTTWFANLREFKQGVGLFGGGDAEVSAGRDIRGLSVSIPTNGRVGGGLPTTAIAQRYVEEFGLVYDWGCDCYVEGVIKQLVPETVDVPGGGTPAVLAVNGRGDLRLTAGGDLATAQLFVGGGDADVRAGGSITTSPISAFNTSSSQVALTDIGSVFLTGKGSLRVQAGGSIAAELRNPFMDTPGGLLNIADVLFQGRIFPGVVSGYDPEDGANLIAGGGITLANTYRARLAVNLITFRGQPGGNNDGPVGGLPPVLPPTLKLTAMGGDIGFGDGEQKHLYPSAIGQLELVAGGSILPHRLRMGDFDPDLLPRWDRPVGHNDYTGFEQPTALLNGTALPALAHVPGQLHVADDEPILIYALSGDIERNILELAKVTKLRAGNNIADLRLQTQNLDPDDLTIVQAGRDIFSSQPPFDAGNLIQVGGPGRLRIVAGRDIAQVLQFKTTGNAANPYLPEQGAAIDVLFGVGAGLNAAGFVEAYLAPEDAGAAFSTYDLNFDADGGWTLTADSVEATSTEDMARVRDLTSDAMLTLAEEIYFHELDATGKEVNQPDSPRFRDYARGFAAVSTLFPAKAYDGNFNLQKALLRTDQGGGIRVLGPGGNFLLGAITTVADNDPANLGTMTFQGGAIDIFAHGDVQIGQSRVMTIDSGNILIWSSTKDINAGKGAKTSKFVPPISVQYDEYGTRSINAAGLVTGAGIATLDSNNRGDTSDINLIAPVGTVDAGDAGIRSSGNLNVAALQVLNADNIQVQGEAIGVPVVAAVNIGALSAASSAASAVAEEAQKLAEESRQRQPVETPAIISVRFLGFGS